jgi:outer membrane receptor protein involved in Fe transport
LAASGAGSAAWAADEAAPGATDEIVVTAQKRSEDIKDVPLGISVIGGATLDTQKITNYEDLGRLVPSLSVTNKGGSNLSRLTLRGVASDQGSATVGVYLDEISLTIPNLFFTGATLPSLFDLDHVEVLRGPQGTLYGASSMGGTIRFISKKPKLDAVEGEVRGDLSKTRHGGGNYLAQAIVNMPIVADRLAMRIGVQRSDDSGFVDRIGKAGHVFKGVNDQRNTTVRAALLYRPSETLTFEPAILRQEAKSSGVSLFDSASLPRYVQNKLSKEYNNDTLTVPSLTVKADLGHLNLTSVTSYLRRINKRSIDAQIYDSEYFGFILDPDFGSTFSRIAALEGVFLNNVYAEQWTQEIRLGSRSIKESGNPFEWQIGGYFSDQTIYSTDDEFVYGLGDAVRDIFGAEPEAVLGAPADNDSVGYFHYNDSIREFAIFTEGSLRVTDKFRATVGLRQSFAKIHYTIVEGGILALGTPPEKERNAKSSPFTPKFALSYEASHQTTLYASAAKGFRFGGNSAPLPTTCGASVAELGLVGDGETYASDSLWSYEAGIKFRTPNSRLKVNMSGYYIDWKNIQQRISLPSCGYVTVVNAGDARSYGGELEVQAQLTDSLGIGISAALVDARVTHAFPGTGARDGQRLIGVPAASFSGNWYYRRPLSATLDGYAQLQLSWTGKSRGSFNDADSDYRRPDYTVVNLVAGVETARFGLSLFARNLLNENKVIQSPSVVFVRQGLTLRPRTIGISANMKF